MDFHCQYYRKRISLSFTGELFREGKKERFCSTPLPEIALCAPQNDAAETLRPQTRSRKAIRDTAQAPQKNQTTHVRTNIPETLHRLYQPSRTRRAQFCRLCFADPTFRLPTASLTQNFLVRLPLSGQLKQSRLPRRPRDPPAPAAGRSPVRRSTRAARPFWAGTPPR